MERPDAVMIAVDASEEEPYAPQVQEAEMADDEMFSEIAPKGRFSSKALNSLVKSTNKLLPAFDQEPSYPEFDPGKYEVFPTDFTRILSMFTGASRDAAAENSIPSDLVVSLDGVTDDPAVNLLAGKIGALSKSREFKKFLDEEIEEESAEPIGDEPEGSEGADLSDEGIDDLFASRM